jgi:hypothetical protein
MITKHEPRYVIQSKLANNIYWNDEEWSVDKKKIFKNFVKIKKSTIAYRLIKRIIIDKVISNE